MQLGCINYAFIMNKSEKVRNERAKYVKKRVNESRNASVEIRRLSKELFLSERTIERDLERNLNK